ncbi:hypothetical protein SBA3_950004 [Candidatus Sulfopaludibacter sp. SbA3]|nr:hypothetical protein SBA3_950004 [Candidatus Sulfopaludibacter sp. SbA3]
MEPWNLFNSVDFAKSEPGDFQPVDVRQNQRSREQSAPVRALRFKW